MKENFYTEALDEINKYVADISNEVAEAFKGTVPFDSTPVDMYKMEDIYDRLGQDPLREYKLRYLVETYGEDRINNLFYNMHEWKKRRQAHAKR